MGGIALGALQPWNTRRAADYKAMGAAHATWLRSDLGWMYLEPTRGGWRFDQYDPVVADAKANGMRYLAILHTVPDWAGDRVRRADRRPQLGNRAGAGDHGDQFAERVVRQAVRRADVLVLRPRHRHLDREQHFGVLRHDGTAKPAYATLASLFTR